MKKEMNKRTGGNVKIDGEERWMGEGGRSGRGKVDERQGDEEMKEN